MIMTSGKEPYAEMRRGVDLFMMEGGILTLLRIEYRGETEDEKKLQSLVKDLRQRHSFVKVLWPTRASQLVVQA